MSSSVQSFALDQNGWQLSSLIQALHCGLDVSCYSTHNMRSIRGGFSPFTHRAPVEAALWPTALWTKFQQGLSLKDNASQRRLHYFQIRKR
jgi:hypothetical protein